jgi:hypothetical protein
MTNSKRLTIKNNWWVTVCDRFSEAERENLALAVSGEQRHAWVLEGSRVPAELREKIQGLQMNEVVRVAAAGGRC